MLSLVGLPAYIAILPLFILIVKHKNKVIARALGSPIKQILSPKCIEKYFLNRV
jgi:hypothetical protein